jgi:4-amino-4-deoxychorismate lyase
VSAPRTVVAGDPAGALAPDDRGLVYGDGLFETLALRAGVLRFRARHLARLGAGLGRLGFAVDPGVVDTVLDAAAAGLHDGVVRLVVTRGTGPRGYAPPAAPRPTIMATAYPGAPGVLPAGPLRLHLCRTPVVEHPALGGLKTLGRLAHVLARAEWQDPAVGEGLMPDAAGRYVCGTASNLFVVVQGRLVTPSVATAGVRGIMRDVVLEAATELGLPWREGPVDAGLLAGAGEVFMTNAVAGILPVAAVAGRTLVPGPVTRRLAAALVGRGVAECAAWA